MKFSLWEPHEFQGEKLIAKSGGNDDDFDDVDDVGDNESTIYVWRSPEIESALASEDIHDTDIL